MSLNGVTKVNAAYVPTVTEQAPKQKESSKVQTPRTSANQTANSAETSEAVRYEAGTESNKSTAKADKATIERLKADAEAKNAQLRSLVEKMLLKQGETFNASTDIYALLRSGKLEVDAETAAKAKQDIAEDGYWGVEQTSDRMVSFAKALAGNDPEKADAMIKAVKKGFDEATKAWGDKLPDISQRTLDATIEKLNKWKEELS